MSLTSTWYCAWYGDWVSRRAWAITVLTSVWVPEPYWYPSPIQPLVTCPPPRNAVMPSGWRYWSAGCVPSWLTPYRKPSPTAGRRPVTDARFTLSDSAAAALCTGPSVGTASASTVPATIASLPGMALTFIGSLVSAVGSGIESIARIDSMALSRPDARKVNGVLRAR